MQGTGRRRRGDIRGNSHPGPARPAGMKPISVITLSYCSRVAPRKRSSRATAMAPPSDSIVPVFEDALECRRVCGQCRRMVYVEVSDREARLRHTDDGRGVLLIDTASAH